jgi:VPDSG-CTERM exosortase interaction domain
MNSRMKIQLVIAGSLICAGSVLASPVNVTIYDGQTASGYVGSGIGGEDNDTEPGTIKSDAWDLEALGYTASTRKLDVIGTYNFATGETAHGKTYRAGAIFIGSGSSLPGAHDWSYAYVLNFNNNTYSLYNSFSIVLPTDIPASSPWTITSSANPVATGSFDYLTGLANPDGFDLTVMNSGYANQHNMISLSLTDLPAELLSDFYIHTTMECGNDVLNGYHQSVPDSGMTLGLLGMGITGLALIRRKLA